MIILSVTGDWLLWWVWVCIDEALGQNHPLRLKDSSCATQVSATNSRTTQCLQRQPSAIASFTNTTSCSLQTQNRM